MLGYFPCFLSSAVFTFQNHLFKRNVSRIPSECKQFGSRIGAKFGQAQSGSKLFPRLSADDTFKLEKLNVLKRSPDLPYNVKVGQCQLRHIICSDFVFTYMVVVAIILVK